MSFTNSSSINRFNILFTKNKTLGNNVIATEIPGISNPVTLGEFQGQYLKLNGDNLNLSEITMTFKMEENFTNYNLIYDWLMNNFLYANDSKNCIFEKVEHQILDASYIPFMSFTYDYVFPTSISSVKQTTSNADELEFDVTFQINIIDKQVY